ncbi:MAG TPA: FAD binding domain-containing protein [Planctomycetota bacterium]|nr:FAD binding domain-containing protein [Planctomycetota bacterium]
MIPAPFDYVRPASLEEALALLAKHGEDAKILAGGHSLLPAMKLRLAQPKLLIDIGRLPDLRFIRRDGNGFAIGALATHYDVESSEILKAGCPLLPEVAASIADVQVRNRGTIGGSLVHADPAGDWSAAMLALDAEMEIAGAGGRRRVKAREFFVDMFQSAVGRDEILASIHVPSTGKHVAYEKFANKASGFAICGVAVVSAATLAIGVTGVAAKPYLASSVETLVDGVDVLSDLHASGDFRAHLARVHARRALERARRKT